MWTWIYYVTITIMSLNICSTVAIVQMMATAGDVEEEIRDSREADNNRATLNDIESGNGVTSEMTHRKSRTMDIAF